jgi:hypothetical protein
MPQRGRYINLSAVIDLLEHRMGFEPMNTGFADQRVSHFAIGAHIATQSVVTICSTRIETSR